MRGTVDGDSVIGEQGERREAAAQLGGIGAGDPGPVAGEIEHTPAGAAVRIGDRQPLPHALVKRHLAAGEFGELGLGLDAVAETEAGAGDAVRPPPPVAVAHGLEPPVPFGADRRHAAPYRDGAAQPGHVPEPLGEGPPAEEQVGQRAQRIGRARRIEHRRHRRPGMGVLVGDEVEQGACPQERHRLADGAALRLQGDLGAAQGEHARQRPAREGQDPIHRAGGEEQGIEPEPRDSVGAEGMGGAGFDAPDQGVRAVIEAPPHRRERGVDRLGLARLEAVEGAGRARESRRRTAVDLAAALRRLVHQDRREAVGDEGFGGARSRRSRAHDQDRGPTGAHDASPAARTRIPSRTSVVQARARVPSSKATQQSWQAPMLQKPTRTPSPNSERRSATP